MNSWRKPLLINGAIAALLLLFDGLTGGAGDGMYVPRFALSGIVMLLLAPVNLVIGIVRSVNRKNNWPVYIMLSGLLALVGFSVCTIN